MSIDAKKLQVIEKIVQLRDVYTLEQIIRLLGNSTSNTTSTTSTPAVKTNTAPSQPKYTTQTVSRRPSSDDKLDALIEKNMPTPEKSMTIEEIRALAAKAEQALKEGGDNTNAIFKAIKE